MVAMRRFVHVDMVTSSGLPREMLGGGGGGGGGQVLGRELVGEPSGASGWQ